MADLDRIIDKVRKLFALGTSPNEHEAAAAVAKARALLEEYDLTIESIGDLTADSRTGIRKGSSIVSVTNGKPEGWKWDLFESVAQAHECHTACLYVYDTTPGGKQRSIKTGNLIGFGHDVEAAGYAMSFLVGEIERLAQAYADVLWAEIRGYRDANGLTQHDAESQYTERTGRHPLKAKLYFIKGATESVVGHMNDIHWERAAKAREAQRAADSAGTANPYAVVLAKDSAISDFIFKERYGKTRAEANAEWEAQRSRIAGETTCHAVAVKVETDAQRRKREEREQRANERYWSAQDRKRERELAKMDRDAFGAGSEAGASIRVRPGIKAGRPAGQIQ